MGLAAMLEEERPDIFAEGQRLSRHQAINLFNLWMAGLSPDARALLNVPNELVLPEVDDTRAAIFEKRKRRNACQFLRDMADSMDPDGTLASRQGPSPPINDLAQIIHAHGMPTNQVIQIIEAHLEKKAN